jgi:hypothetical protein
LGNHGIKWGLREFRAVFGGAAPQNHRHGDNSPPCPPARPTIPPPASSYKIQHLCLLKQQHDGLWLAKF